MSDQSPGRADFEAVEHTADWALRVRGRDLRALLENAARGLSDLLADDAALISTEIEQRIEIEAGDAESLLVDWLSELAFWAEMEGVVFHKFELETPSPTRLNAVVRGGAVVVLRKHIKAVTYHNLQIIETGDGLEATIVFDV